MAKIVVGLLDSANEAEQVEDELVRSNFDRNAIALTRDAGDQATPQSPVGRTLAGGIAEGLTQYGVPKEHAAYYGEGVRRGSVLVTVICDEVNARLASEIMNRHGAVDIDKRASEWRQAESRETGAFGTMAGERRHAESDADAANRSAGTLTGAYAGKERRQEARTGFRQSAGSWNRDEVLPVVEEDVAIGARPVAEDVVLREKRTGIERRRVDRLSAAESDQAFRERTIGIPETAEEPVISKPARVREEVLLGRDAAERTERVRESVRSTDVDVQGERDEGFLDPDDADFQQHFQSYYASRGEDYRGFRDAYRYGATMSQYTSKDWQDVEEDIHRDWDRDHPGTWNTFREAIHYGWEKTHRH